MLNRKRQIIGLSAIVLLSLGLGGCATTDYVDEKVAAVQSQVTAHDQRLGALDGKVGQLESHATQTDAALNKIAAGKFVYQKVAEETVLFDTGSFALKPEETTKLDQLVGRLKAEDKGVYVEIEGFADPRGTERKNRELSLRRARSVYNYMRDQGVALNRMMLFNQGEEHQVGAPGDNADNRRVVITVVQ